MCSYFAASNNLLQPIYYSLIAQCRGPRKKKAKTTKYAQSYIMPLEDEVSALSMSFPPR